MIEGRSGLPRPRSRALESGSPPSAALALLVALVAVSEPAAAEGLDPPAIEDAIGRGSQALERLSSPEGGWRSATYGILRPGRALTPFALAALAVAQREIDPAVLEAALRFLDEVTTEEGSVAAGGGVLDYPNYATAYAILALLRLRPGGFEARVARMAEHLERDQASEELGFSPSDEPYGGWGFGGAPRRKGDAGATPDLSTTTVVLEALAAAGRTPDSPVFRRAHLFAVRCQRSGDAGGFLFNPVDLSANKSAFLARTGVHPTPYATATLDGVAALLLAGSEADSEPVRQATEWLRAHPDLDRPGGFPSAEPPRWDLGLRYYFWWSLSRAMLLLEERRSTEDPVWPGWRREVAGRLVEIQRSDGTWANEVGLSREDDPVIATSFALMTLSACRAR